MKINKNRNTKIGLKQIFGLIKVIKVMKNYPLYFKDFLGHFEDNQDLIYELRNGTKLLVKSNSAGRNLFNEIWIYEDYNFKGFEIKEKDTVLDIGACLGMFTIYASLKANKGKVYSFEPMDYNFEILNHNVKLNKLKNIKTFKLGVADKNGTKNMCISDSLGGHSFYINKKKKIGNQSVRIISLDNVVKNNKIKKIDLLKCDCEGAEYDILFSCKHSLKIIDKIVMEVHYIDKHRNIDTMKSFLENNGFEVFLTKQKSQVYNMLYARR